MSLVQTKQKEPDRYVGETYNQLRNGYGVYTYGNGFFRYEGEWLNGKKHGHGKFLMKDGSFFEGEFRAGEITGHGYRFWAVSKNNFTGQFFQGELQGTGVMKYHDGSVYEGDWWKNRRHGYGMYHMVDNGVYEGNFHENLRHGEGSQLYLNGDKFNGDWVRDKRQGHGEETSLDGSLYEGQWRNNLKNGEGVMIHASGMIYRGLWCNDMPEKLCTKLVIVCDTNPLQLTQGQSFSISVECRDENDEPTEDNGRELQITAGYQHIRPKEGTALFDMIEDVEETPVPTPFGYDIVPYPLTDQLPDSDELEFLKSDTNMSDLTIPETDKEEVSGDEGEDKEAEIAPPILESEQTLESIISTDEKKALPERVGSPVPTPIPTQRTVSGLVKWEKIGLAQAPPMYRPFAVLDDEAMSPSTVTSNQGRRKSKLSKDEKISLKNRLGDERFSRPGEYVLMVEDATTPQFLGKPPEPGFILIKITALKKTRKVKEPKKNYSD